MGVVRKVVVLSLAITFCLCAALFAQTAGRIESMKLLTANTGWAATHKKLFWTNDGGTQWKDITPKIKPDRAITSVFFLNSSRGWALLAHEGKEDEHTGVSESLFELASTGDAGDSWSVKQLEVGDPDPSRGLSAETWLDFVDAMHGWVLVRLNGNTAISIGALEFTEDGGNTWKALGAPVAGPIRFVTQKDGWLTGGPTEDEIRALFVTHDGGRSWQEQRLKPPSQTHAAVYPTYDLPIFEDSKSGFVPVSFSGPDGASSALALFATEDGGVTWHPERVLINLPETSQGALFPSVVAGSTWMTAAVSDRSLITTTTEKGGTLAIGPSKTARADVANLSKFPSIVALDFADANRGWLLFFNGELVSTSTGGAAWEKITPAPADMKPPQGKPVTAPVKTEPIGGSLFRSELAPSSTGVSTHLGFDRFPVIPSSDMQTWQNSSPFYDVGIYLPGSKNKTTDSKLTPMWISAVQGQQGWGIMPIWFGLQSSCACRTQNPCVPYTYQFSTNPTQAKMDGINEAKAAISSAQTLGLNPTVIYKDIENYTPDGSTCSLPVQAFLSGWDQQMQTVGKAGVYGNPLPAGDFAKASPIPDDVWIAKYSSPPQFTIWGLGKLADSPNWTTGQRIRQVQQNVTQNWSSPNIYKIDPDIEDAPVVNPNAFAKSYTYTQTNIDCPGAISTIPTAINDMNNGAFISGPGQTGTVIGTYQASLTSPYYGYQNTGGTCTNISVFGSTNTQPWGINNLGQIVGFFEDSNAANHGFLLSPGKSPVQIDYPAGGQTYLYGINDAGQIVGYAYSAGTFGYQTFMYYGGQFYPLGVSGGGNFDYTLGFGINGDATLTGTYYFQPYKDDFELSAVPSLSGNTITWSGTVTDLTPGGIANTIAKGINANGELAGFYQSSACGNTAFQCGFEWSGGFLLDVLQYGSDANVAEGLNDLAQIVGPYTDSITGYSHGQVWTHQ